MTHSIIPPSSAGIWGKPDGCTGWVLMNQMYPETESSPESLEGQASHEIGAVLIEQSSRAVNGRYWKQFDGKSDANGTVFTEEMFDGAVIYADDVAEVMRDTAVFGGKHLNIEQSVTMPAIHEMSHGTPDCWIYNKSTGELFIWDYKFGYEVVEAFENWQLIDYVSGILDQLGIHGGKDPYITVHFRIIQPRAFHRDGVVREWVVPASDLRAYFNILNCNAHRALGPDAEFRTGSHCKHCPGRHACEPALSVGMRLFEMTSKPTPVELSPQDLGVQLNIIKRARKHLESLESGFDEQVKGLIRKGVSVPGWIAEDGVGRPKWNKPIDEIIAMGDLMKIDVRKPEDAITPIQAGKLGIDEAVITAYSTKPRTGLKIVPDNGSRAREVFSK